MSPPDSGRAAATAEEPGDDQITAEEQEIVGHNDTPTCKHVSAVMEWRIARRRERLAAERGGDA